MRRLVYRINKGIVAVPMNLPAKIILKIIIPMILYLLSILFWPMGIIFWIPAYKLIKLH